MASEKTNLRRTWKPDVLAIPWISLCDETNVLIKAHITRDNYNIFLFDGIHMWHEECSKEEVISKAKKFNPNVEAPVSTLLQHLEDCIHQRGTKPSFSLKMLDHTLTVTITSHLTGKVPFKWNIVAEQTSNNELANHVISPLLCMVSEVLRREKALMSFMKRKDVEIEDMKAGGARVSRKKLETTPFNPKAFQHEMTHSKEFDNIVAEKGKNHCFQVEGQTLYKEIMTTAAWLEHKNKQIEDDDGDDEMPLGITVDHPTVEQSKAAAASPSWANKVPPSLLEGDASTTSSPASHPGSRHSSPRKITSPGNTEDLELMRREALERKLAEEKEKDKKKGNKNKRKKLF